MYVKRQNQNDWVCYMLEVVETSEARSESRISKSFMNSSIV